MAKQHFNVTDLDKLVDESIANADQLKNEISGIDLSSSAFEINSLNDENYLNDNDMAWSDNKNIVDKESGGAISYDYVYKKIGQLIDTGNASLQMLQSIDPDVTNPATLGATASLLNSIRGCISEFTKIHQQYIRFQQTLQLEKIKLENRKEIIKYRRAVNNGQLESDIAPTELIETSSTDIMNYLAFQKEQEKLEKAKNEKV
jgi:hypothetical protein